MKKTTPVASRVFHLFFRMGEVSCRLVLVPAGAASVALSASACSGAPQNEATGQSDQSIINGTLIPPATQQSLGLVTVTAPGLICSGVLLANDWVLTAGHCVTLTGPGRSQSMSASIVEPSGPPSQSGSDAIYMLGNRTFGWVPDLAIFHVRPPLTVNGSTSGFSNPIDTTPSASLPQPLALTNYGIGLDVLATSSTPSSSDGLYRSAVVTTSAIGNHLLQVTPNASGQIGALGDSGGGYFRTVGGVEKLVSITSTGDLSCLTNTSPCPSTQITAVQDVVSTDVADYLGWINAVLQSQWFPTRSAETLDIFSGEISGLGTDAANRNTASFTDVNAVPWYAAARDAEYACFDRGFRDGHFDGQQIPPRYGLTCQGGNSKSSDVSVATIDSTPEPFSDVTAIGWAQANREAGIICHDKQGFVGGFFDGWQSLNGSNSAFGITCVNSNSVYFLVTAADLAKTGWPVSNVDTVNWAQAYRAANVYCSQHGFVGGFPNGQQDHAAQTFGLICEK